MSSHTFSPPKPHFLGSRWPSETQVSNHSHRLLGHGRGSEPRHVHALVCTPLRACPALPLQSGDSQGSKNSHGHWGVSRLAGGSTLEVCFYRDSSGRMAIVHSDDLKGESTHTR